MDKQNKDKNYGAERLVFCVRCGKEVAIKNSVELFDGEIHCAPCARIIQRQIERGAKAQSDAR